MKRYKDYGAIMRGLASTALERTFGAEWIDLDSQRARLIRQDFLEASEHDNITASEYARRIGKGNLKAYGDVMIVRERKGWDKNPKYRGPLEMRTTPLTPEEITKFRILKKMGGKQLERRLPAWARAKTLPRFEFTPGRPAQYPGWTARQAMTPAVLNIPDPNKNWTPAEYVREFNRLNSLKGNPMHRLNPLSKKNYIKVAALFRDAKEEDERLQYTGPQMWQTLLEGMSGYFQSDNPRFDRERFYAAAGYVGKNPSRVRTTARRMVKRFGKRRARRMAGEQIDRSRTRRRLTHWGKVRRAINPRKAKYQIQVHGNWLTVTHNIFRSWGGKRRVNGKSYSGPRFYLGTKIRAK